jgi:putative protease
VRGLSPSHRGVCAGTVVAPPRKNTVRVRPLVELSAGDGVAFGAAASDAGGSLWGVHADGGSGGGGGAGGEEKEEVTLELEDATKLEGVAVGDLVWRTQHAALQRQLKGALADQSAGRALVDVSLSGDMGAPLTVTVTDGRGRSASAATDAVLEPASGAPLTEKGLRKAVGQLGGTPLMVRHLDVAESVTDGAWLPLSQLKEARRMAVERLVELRASQRVEAPPKPTTVDGKQGMPKVQEGAVQAQAEEAEQEAEQEAATRAPHLSVLCRTQAQVEAAAACAAVDEIVIDFLELDGIMEGLAAARPKKTVVAAPRIIKPAEEALWRVLLKLDGADALLVRSAGLLSRLSLLAEAEGVDTLPRIHGDFSLNVANAQAARAYLGLHVARLTPTFDLDASQLCDLANALPPAQRNKIEVVVHTNVPIFHTEHCVFARCLSSGNSYKDCGHPCTRHSLHLVVKHPADAPTLERRPNATRTSQKLPR